MNLSTILFLLEIFVEFITLFIFLKIRRGVDSIAYGFNKKNAAIGRVKKSCIIQNLHAQTRNIRFGRFNRKWKEIYFILRTFKYFYISAYLRKWACVSTRNCIERRLLDERLSFSDTHHFGNRLFWI